MVATGEDLTALSPLQLLIRFQAVSRVQLLMQCMEVVILLLCETGLRAVCDVCLGPCEGCTVLATLQTPLGCKHCTPFTLLLLNAHPGCAQMLDARCTVFIRSCVSSQSYSYVCISAS